MAELKAASSVEQLAVKLAAATVACLAEPMAVYLVGVTVGHWAV
jgi:hypothetical protein